MAHLPRVGPGGLSTGSSASTKPGQEIDTFRTVNLNLESINQRSATDGTLKNNDNIKYIFFSFYRHKTLLKNANHSIYGSHEKLELNKV